MVAVAKDPQALTPALIMVGIASIATALGTMLFPSVMDLVTYQSGLGDVVMQASLSIIFGIAVLYITGYFAEQIFHSKLDMNGYVRVMGHATLVSVLGLLPALSPLAGLWSLVVMCVVLSRLGKMQPGSIVLLILMEILVFVGIALIMMVFGLGMGMGGMMF